MQTRSTPINNDSPTVFQRDDVTPKAIDFVTAPPVTVATVPPSDPASCALDVTVPPADTVLHSSVDAAIPGETTTPGCTDSAVIAATTTPGGCTDSAVPTAASNGVPSVVTTNATVTTAHSLASSNSSMVENAEFSDSEGEDDDLDSALAHASACSTTPGMTRAAIASIHSDGYCSKKRAVIRSFIENLADRAPKYNKFLKTTNRYPDWFVFDGPVENVFVMLSPSGSGDRMKKIKTLSEMLIDWVDGLEMKKTGGKKKKWHAPSTLNVMVRSLLAGCKDFFGWEFSISDFKFDGGFNAYFKDLVETRRKEDVSEFLKKVILF